MYDSVELGDAPAKDFLNHFPAVEIANKQYSLEADIITGWRPRNKVMGPIPLNCDSHLLDQVIDELTSFGSRHKERVIFLGQRFSSSFKMHLEMPRTYPFKYEGCANTSYPHMAAYFRKFHSNFKSKNTRIFRGMNPTIRAEEELTFESNFESGNLDAVIKVGDNEYDLYLRIDTNTRGHLQWYNFTVRNCGKKKVRFNIVNFKKAKTLYQRGMKPYIYSEYLKQTKDQGWEQSGQNVKYFKRKLTYPFLEDYYEEEQITLNCLQFDHTFEVDWELVQFAYSPPFTYSQLNQLISKLAAQNPKEKQAILKEEVLCESLSGLEIPLLTITDPEVDNRRKKCILVSGRIHPGQSCSSFMGQGILEYICADTEEAEALRRNVIFKVIPMLNPDGVVVGNFRTSLCGRDLNRTFKMSNDFLIPEVRALKEIVIKLKSEYKGRLIMFLDLHGHSVKKNVFLYGPEYDIWQTNYYKTRIFPKLISNQTEMFRYYSCLFRVAEFKKSTARAVLLRTIPHCYTIQASTGFYYCPIQKKDIPFTPDRWIFMGRKLGQSIKDYIEMLNEEVVNKEERKQKLTSLKTVKNAKMHAKKHSEKLSLNKFQTRIITNSSQKGKGCSEEPLDKPQQETMNLSKKARDLIQSIKEDEKKHIQEKRSEGHDSDEYSEGGSDSESAEQDMKEQEMNSFQDQLYSFMQEFRQKFYREKAERQYSLKQPARRKPKDEEPRPKRQQKGIQLIASLRKKAQQSEKARELIVWTKIKEEFKEAKSRSGGEIFNPRNTLSRVEGLPSRPGKPRRLGVQSQILEKQELTLGFRDAKMAK